MSERNEQADYDIDWNRFDPANKQASTLKNIRFAYLQWVLAFKTLKFALDKTLGAWHTQELAVHKINTAMVAQGVYSRKLSERYQKTASAIQAKTTVGDEAILDAQSTLQALIGNQEITEQMMMAVVDFAAGANMDLASAARAVGTSIGGPNNALSRYGIEIDAAASKDEKTKAIVQGLNAKYGGQAEAAAGGLGAMVQMSNSLGDLFEVVGKFAAPAVIVFSNKLRLMADALNENNAFMSTIKEVVDGVGAGILVAKGVILASVRTVATAAASAFAAGGQLFSGNITVALDQLASGKEEVYGILKEQKSNTYAELTALVDARNAAESAREAEKAQTLSVAQAQRNQAAINAKAEVDAILFSRAEDQITKDLVESELKNDYGLISLQRQIDSEKNKTKRLELEAKKRKLIDDKTTATKARLAEHQGKVHEGQLESMLASTKVGWDMFASMRSKIGPLMAAQKSLALVQIALNTAISIRNTFAFFAAIPFIGGILAAIASIAIALFGAEQAANVVGLKMAEGGIVSHGGGHPSVSPLPKSGMLGRRVNVTINGGLSGSEEELMTIANLIHKEVA